MARPATGQTPPISFRPPPQLLKDFDATIEEGRSRSDVLIELMHDRVTKRYRAPSPSLSETPGVTHPIGTPEWVAAKMTPTPAAAPTDPGRTE